MTTPTELETIKKALIDAANVLFNRWGDTLSMGHGNEGQIIHRYHDGSGITFRYFPNFNGYCLTSSGWHDGTGQHQDETLELYLKAIDIIENMAYSYIHSDYLARRDRAIEKLNAMFKILQEESE
jgi:hypothetical protein